jgi:hypothetical protein
MEYDSGFAIEHHRPEVLEGLTNRKDEIRYCTYPFRLLAICSDFVKPCTWLREVSGVSVVAIQELVKDGVSDATMKEVAEVWNCNAFNNVRRSIAEGEYLLCNLGNCPEYLGTQDFFMTLPELDERFPAIARFVRGESEDLECGPEMLNMAYDTRCNLSCPSCSRTELPQHPPSVVQGIGKGLKHLGRDAKTIFLAGMGDPFATNHYLEWLCSLDVEGFPNLEQVSLLTNALNWTEETWDLIPEKIRRFVTAVTVSVDGATKTTYEENRFPGKWSVFVDRMKFIADLRRRGEISYLSIYYVYRENNFREMPAMVDFAREHAVDTLFFARIRDWRGWGDDVMDRLDVNRPSHPLNAEFSEVAAIIEGWEDPGLRITIMR